MISLKRQTKVDLFNTLKNEKDAFGPWHEQNGILGFLNAIWNLRSMPSEDARYKDAHGDIVQHTISNDDWDYDYLFLERLKLLEADDKFILFIESILDAKFRQNEDEIIKFVLVINPYLEKEGYKLAIKEFADNGLPVYSIQIKEEVDDLPIDVKKNTIKFFVDKKPNGNSKYASNHKTPPEFPSFLLAFNSGWNDYGLQTEFNLFFYDQNKLCTYIGEVKIITDSTDSTINKLPDSFFTLEDSFCSLGQAGSYYFGLKALIERSFESVVYALNDAAFKSEVHEKFENTLKFTNSLLRSDEAERILRQVKYSIYGYDLANLYKFRYSFKPLFAEKPTEINFNFDVNDQLPNRIYAIIGKNGTGKTQLITSLPIKISEKREDSFVPRTPLFSKVIAVSYSAFDQFEIPKRTAAFNYVYCGLRQEKDEGFTKKGLTLRFHHSWKKVKNLGRMSEWREVLLNFLEEDVVNEFIIPAKKSQGAVVEFDVSVDGYNNIKNSLSSGQNVILYIITEIVANIRFDSLLLYDEPETHLHPNAISQLMNTIFELVQKFQSYCIITTHSPLIIRELMSKSVYVIERIDNSVSIKHIGLECFGENLTTLTEEVFGNKSIPKHYKKILKELADEGKTFEDILSLLEYDNVPLSLNARMYLKAILKD